MSCQTSTYRETLMSEMQKYTEAVVAIKEAIQRSQYRASFAVNKEMLSLFYAVGRYISENSRVGFWGQGAIAAISSGLQKEMPGLRGFSATSLRNMRIFYEQWQPIVNHQPAADDLQVNEKLLLSVVRQPLADELNWNEFISLPFSHHIEILSKTDSLEQRIFYIHESVGRSWNKYTLREYLKADLYANRGNLPNNFDKTLPESLQVVKATKAFKEEYLLDFINVESLGESHEDVDERLVERQIVQNVKAFIMKFGLDFTFVGNQYRIVVAGEEMFIDLLFFNRELNCLVAVELKAGKFKMPYLGQLNGYLAALDQFVKKPHENPSIGIILCRDMNKAFVEFAIRDYDKPMGVATYKTNASMPEKYRNALPDIDELRKLLETK